MVSSVGHRVIFRAFWASGYIFLISGLKTKNKQRNKTGKYIPFYCD